MALSRRSAGFDQYLVTIGNFSEAEKLCNSLRKNIKSPFTKIIYMKGEYGIERKNFTRRFFISYFGGRYISNEILRIVSREKEHHLYLFNEERPYSLHLLDYARKNLRKVSFVEDGAASYNSQVGENKSLRCMLFGKIVFGAWWKNVPVMGTSKTFDSIWMNFPDHARPELLGKIIHQIPHVHNYENDMKQIAGDVLSQYGINVKEIERINCIILLSHSSVIRSYPAYKDILMSVIKQAQSLRYKVAIKYHPRDEDGGDCFNLRPIPGLHFIPSSAPLEFIYLLAKNNIKLIIADLSTSLLTGVMVLKSARIISTGALLNSKDRRFMDMLRSLGVKLPTSHDEFKKMLEDPVNA